MKLGRIIAVFLLQLAVGSAFAEPVYWITLECERNGSEISAPRRLIEASHKETLQLSVGGASTVAMLATVQALPMETPADELVLEMVLSQPTKSGDRQIENAAAIVRLGEPTEVRLDKEKNKMSVTVLVEPAPGQTIVRPASGPGSLEALAGGIQTQPLHDHH